MHQSLAASVLALLLASCVTTEEKRLMTQIRVHFEGDDLPEGYEPIREIFANNCLMTGKDARLSDPLAPAPSWPQTVQSYKQVAVNWLQLLAAELGANAIVNVQFSLSRPDHAYSPWFDEFASSCLWFRTDLYVSGLAVLLEPLTLPIDREPGCAQHCQHIYQSCLKSAHGWLGYDQLQARSCVSNLDPCYLECPDR